MWIRPPRLLRRRSAWIAKGCARRMVFPLCDVKPNTEGASALRRFTLSENCGRRRVTARPPPNSEDQLKSDADITRLQNLARRVDGSGAGSCEAISIGEEGVERNRETLLQIQRNRRKIQLDDIQLFSRVRVLFGEVVRKCLRPIDTIFQLERVSIERGQRE